MNEHIKNQEQQVAVTPPPFRQSEEPVEQPQEPATSPTLAQRIAAMDMDEEKTRRLTLLTQGLTDTATSDELLDTLVQGIMHDEDVQNADAAGYLRGRNEKIEAVMHPQPQDDEDETQVSPVFPQYCRRSIWD
ncbi:MAG: hypothetical protein SPL96_00200 [Bacteroidales bacterium]|nr:hypothetical protein [Bacteroidales bacterium]